MKQDWEIKEFEDCLDKVVYTNKVQRKDFLEAGKYPIISQEQDFINGYWNSADDAFKITKPVVIFGDHTQVLKYVDFDFVLGADGVKILLPKKSINSRFFYYFLKSINLGSLGYARHYRLLKEISVSYPKSLPEQERIVTLLDETIDSITKGIVNAELNLNNTRELFESYISSLFVNKGDGWDDKILGELIEIRNGKNQKTVLSDKGKYKIMGSAGNVMGYATDYICEAGTTIIGRKGNISKPIYINERFWNVDTAFGLYPKDSDKIDKRFVYYLCLGIDFKSMDRGTTIPSLVKSELKTIPISVPKSLGDQRAIVNKLDELSAETDKLKTIYKQKINDLEELKKSVLQKAFAGELKTSKVEVMA
jgi:type I restriction enzyme S subunit